jgi:hypothetical protein
MTSPPPAADASIVDGAAVGGFGDDGPGAFAGGADDTRAGAERAAPTVARAGRSGSWTRETVITGGRGVVGGGSRADRRANRIAA